MAWPNARDRVRRFGSASASVGFCPSRSGICVRSSVAGRPPSVLVLTDRGDIPWEVAIGRRCSSVVGGRPLGWSPTSRSGSCRRAPAARTSRLPLAMHCGTIVAAAVGPKALPNLPRLGYAEGEAARLRDGHGAVTIRADSGSDLFPWLEGRFPCDLLHIASHGGFDPERGLTVIGLADGDFLDAPAPTCAIDLRGTIVVLNVANAADPVLVERGRSWAAPGPSSRRAGRSSDRLAAELVGILYDAAFDGNLATGCRLARGAAAVSRIVRMTRRRSRTRCTAIPRPSSSGAPGPSRGTSPGTDRAAGRSSGMRDRSRRLAWSPDGTRIYTASEDGAPLDVGRSDGTIFTDQHVAAVPVDFLSSGSSGWIATLSASEVMGGSGRQRVLIPGSSALSALAPSKTSRGRLTRSGPRLPSSSGTLRSPTVTRASKRFVDPGTPTKLAWTARRVLAVGTSEGATHLVSADSHEVLRTYREDRDRILGAGGVDRWPASGDGRRHDAPRDGTS